MFWAIRNMKLWVAPEETKIYLKIRRRCLIGEAGSVGKDNASTGSLQLDLAYGDETCVIL